MKTNDKSIPKEKEFDTVKTFRGIKDEISKKLYGKTAKEIRDYLKANSLKLQAEK